MTFEPKPGENWQFKAALFMFAVAALAYCFM